MPRAKLSNVSIKQLVAEIERRKSRLTTLIAQRDVVNKEIAELEGLGFQTVAAPAPAPAAIAARRGRKPGRRGRPRGPGRPAKVVQVTQVTGKPLGAYVTQVLSAAGKGLSVKEIEAAVRKAGYPTTAETIYNPIMKALAKGNFKKVDRGIYTVKGAAAAAAKMATPRPAGAKAPKTRGTFAQTAEEFILGLAKGDGMTSFEINKKWTSAGRGGKADTTLSRMVKAGKLKRAKLKEGKGSTYSAA